MRKFLSMAIIAVILFCSCTQAATGLAPESAQEPEKPEGTIIYGKIRSANGNEIVLVVGEPETQSAGGARGSGTTDRGEAPQGEAAQDGMPQRKMIQGEAPQGEAAQDGMPQRKMIQGEAPQGEAAQDGMPQRKMIQGETPQDEAAQSEAPRDETAQESRQGGGQRTQEMPEGGTLDVVQYGGSPDGGQGGTRTIMRGNAGGQTVSLSYTGEERTYVIPVTAKITTGSGESERTLRFTQLAYKNVVQVTLGDNGSITAIQVLS